ncbi:MAG TPA: 16S rRNA (cytosine(1402)-N(4))-methyltransferase RsmH [Micropepsaceae bacterium]|nr:16S rRNA (cytosine(1402)-N(4))-methyltransferase RsmH [Micropepsaceae bacterium]
MGGTHIPVLLEEVMAVLQPRDNAIYVDGTFGGGGYSGALLSRATCRVIAIDRDADAIERGGVLRDRFSGRLTLLHGRFSEMDMLLGSLGMAGADGIALDIGVSSFQLDDSMRGFSFSSDAPLDMRMDRGAGQTAADLCNTLTESELAEILKNYGEENRARAIARAIIAARPVVTARQLADVIERVSPRRGQKIHPATRSFQALRIAVNDELGELERGLEAAERLLNPHGRIAVVTFHSLEDRIVKRFFAERFGRNPGASRHLPERAAPPALFHGIGKSPVTPSAEEIRRNPRARSAKLRAAERTQARAPMPAQTGEAT